MASVSPVGQIRTEVWVPPDKSISHRAFIFNAIATGRAVIESPLDSADVRSTVNCLRALGAEIAWPEGTAEATVDGHGLHGLEEAEDVLDCGNSGTTMRLLAGLLAAQPMLSILTGDESLRSRDMSRIVSPLRQLGAAIQARKGDTRAPLVIRGGGLQGMTYETPMASAQVKSALLLAGLYAPGGMAVREPNRSRDHTERMLAAMGATVRTAGTMVAVEPCAKLSALSLRVPGDISSAAPWLVLGACHPDAEIVIRGVNVNPTRTGLLDILESMGGRFELLEERDVGGEPVADIAVRSSALHATTVSGALIPRAIDELPLVALLGCFAEGETVVRDAAELVVKETNRVAAVARVLGRFGATVSPRDDGFVVRGRQALHGANADAGGDHRIGMLAGIAGLLATGGETRVSNDAVDVSYPSFWEDVRLAAGQRGT
ncbi:MAG: 3-phosphoshikimate 1-carboxyvinyltransferase [Dehalococcoidia bacterium]